MMPRYLNLLQRLIATESFSRSESTAADILEEYLLDNGVLPKRYVNNVVVRGNSYDKAKPTLMLNSHHDTVKPSGGYTRNPFEASIEDGRIYGLGSNDAGGSLVALTETFLKLNGEELPVNLVLALSAEEEVSGENGMRLLINELENIDMAIVGEPTQMKCAIGERGLLVLDCVAKGKSGHAARHEGVNALYKALDDINRLRSLSFPEVSRLMGPININVTGIQAGSLHNVIPDICTFMVDIRTTDAYTNEQTVSLIREMLTSEVTPRSTHIKAWVTPETHPLLNAIRSLDIDTYLSPTTSDRAIMPWPGIKIGPGDSARSHAADEYIGIEEIEHGIQTYIKIIKNISI